MKELFALLVREHSQLYEALRRTLMNLSMETYSVETSQEAEELITQCKPYIIFAESALGDGSWVNILNVAEAANVPLNSVVLGAILSGPRPMGMKLVLNGAKASQGFGGPVARPAASSPTAKPGCGN